LKRSILVDLSDTHGGHKLGLMNPAVVIFDEDQFGNQVPHTPELTAWQKYLWDLYLESIEQVASLAGGDEIVVLHNGDLAQGNKYPQQLVSTNLANQIIIAQANLEPWLIIPNVRAMRLTIGTGAHEFGEGAATLLVANVLQGKYPDANIAALYHGLADVDGVSVDYAHHGPFPGSRDWLMGNVAGYYLRDLMIREIKAGRKPPDLVLRAHYHAYVRVIQIIDDYESMLVVSPSMCALSDHGHQATRSQHQVTNGIVAFEIVDGKIYKTHKLAKTVDIRTKETI
jgi:hypothetical protein